MNHRHYFVSYNFSGWAGQGHIAINKNKFNVETIIEIRKCIEKDIKETAIIINIIPIECSCDTEKDSGNS